MGDDNFFEYEYEYEFEYECGHNDLAPAVPCPQLRWAWKESYEPPRAVNTVVSYTENAPDFPPWQREDGRRWAAILTLPGSGAGLRRDLAEDHALRTSKLVSWGCEGHFGTRIAALLRVRRVAPFRVARQLAIVVDPRTGPCKKRGGRATWGITDQETVKPPQINLCREWVYQNE